MRETSDCQAARKCGSDIQSQEKTQPTLRMNVEADVSLEPPEKNSVLLIPWFRLCEILHGKPSRVMSDFWHKELWMNEYMCVVLNCQVSSNLFHYNRKCTQLSPLFKIKTASTSLVSSTTSTGPTQHGRKIIINVFPFCHTL